MFLKEEEKKSSKWSEISNACWERRNDEFIKLGDYVVKEEVISINLQKYSGLNLNFVPNCRYLQGLMEKELMRKQPQK